VALTLSSTSTRIHRLRVLIINTGMLTAVLGIFSIAFVSRFAQLPVNASSAHFIQLLGFRGSNLYYSIFQFPICMAYSTAFLANLSMREYVCGGNGTVVVYTNVEDNACKIGDSLGQKGRVVSLVGRSDGTNVEIDDHVSVRRYITDGVLIGCRNQEMSINVKQGFSAAGDVDLVNGVHLNTKVHKEYDAEVAMN